MPGGITMKKRHQEAHQEALPSASGTTDIRGCHHIDKIVEAMAAEGLVVMGTTSLVCPKCDASWIINTRDSLVLREEYVNE
jgi:hypothetical protein